jgi:hypothetical protein
MCARRLDRLDSHPIGTKFEFRKWQVVHVSSDVTRWRWLAAGLESPIVKRELEFDSVWIVLLI